MTKGNFTLKIADAVSDIGLYMFRYRLGQMQGLLAVPSRCWRSNGWTDFLYLVEKFSSAASKTKAAKKHINEQNYPFAARWQNFGKFTKKISR